MKRGTIAIGIAIVAIICGFMLQSPEVHIVSYPGAPADSWCDTDFAKRIDVNVNNTGGAALTNYQVYVNLSSDPINETSLRVYNTSSCTLRPHWCENTTAGNSYGIWINYSAIGASSWINNTAIYYDNIAASSVSNGTNTFDFFDDFENGNLNKWQQTTYGSISTTSHTGTYSAVSTTACCKYEPNLGFISNNFTAIHNCIVEYWFRESTDQALFGLYEDPNNYFKNSVDCIPHAAIRTEFSVKENGASLGTTSDAGDFSINTWYHSKVIVNNTTITWYFDTTDATTQIGTMIHTNIANLDFINFSYVSRGGSTYADDIRIRKYTSLEPVASLGSKENLPGDPYPPPTPTNLQNTSGEYWINHTWSAGSGNITDWYRIKVNNVWHNTTLNTFWNSSYGPLEWQNITVYAWNKSAGNLSVGNISDNVQTPAFSWNYGKNITLLGTDTELTNFPYVISIAKESAMQSDYDDLIFFDHPVYGNGNLIDFEIESYNATTATIWLNITTLPIVGKTISVYYGDSGASSTQNSTAVWNSDYVGTWHLADNISEDTVWNDYKQPDGVINVTEVIGAGYTWIQEPSVYYIDGEFKLWANINNGSSGEYVIGYFNSSDGYNWDFQGLVRNSTGVQIGAGHPFVMQDPDSSGYLLYVHEADASVMGLYNSSGNETNFTMEKHNCINGSDFGASHIGNKFIWKENASDWYAIVDHNNPAWDAIYGTSSNGRDWTWHDPAYANGIGSTFFSPYVWKNNGTYYAVFHCALSGVLPTDIYVAISTNRQDWTYVSGFEITREHYWEGGGSGAGQTADVHLMEYNNEVYIYYTGIHDQGSPMTSRMGLVHLNQTLIEVTNEISSDGSSDSVEDSTSNNNNGIADGGKSISGIIGNAINFSADHIKINTTDFYNLGTVSWWQNTTLLSDQIVFIGAEQSNVFLNRAQLGFNTGGNTSAYIRNSTSVASHLETDANMILINKYQHIVWTSNGSYTKCFVNGTEVSLYVKQEANDGTWFSDIPNIDRYDIGAYYGSGPVYFSGIIDEVELSKSVRSDDWINLSYQMVVNSSYVTFGVEENNVTGTTPVISNVQNGSISSTSHYIDWDVNQTAHNRVVYDNGSVSADSTACEGQWSATHACANASDGNWSTYAESAGALVAYAKFNYTVPSSANQSESLWHVKDAIGHANVTIPSACWDATLYLRAMCSDVGNSVTWQCDNGPGWTTLHTSVANILYEEEMLFKYTSAWDNSTAAPNITLSGVAASAVYDFQAWSYNTTNTTLYDNSSTLSFTTAAETPSTNPITITEGKRALFCNWTANTTFTNIAANLTNCTDFFVYNSSTQQWTFYNINRTINADTFIHKHTAIFVHFNATTTVDCEVLTAETITIPSNIYYYTALRESASKTLTEINTTITSDGCTISDLYAWNSTAGAYTNTGSYSVLANEGFAMYATTGCSWDGSV